MTFGIIVGYIVLLLGVTLFSTRLSKKSSGDEILEPPLSA